MKGSVLSRPPKVKQRMETSGKKMHWPLVVFGSTQRNTGLPVRKIMTADCRLVYNLDKSMTTVLIRPVLQYFHRNRCILITRYTEGTFKWPISSWEDAVWPFLTLEKLVKGYGEEFWGTCIRGKAYRIKKSATRVHQRIFSNSHYWPCLNCQNPTYQTNSPVCRPSSCHIFLFCFVLFCFARGQPGVKFERWKGGGVKHKSVT